MSGMSVEQAGEGADRVVTKAEPEIMSESAARMKEEPSYFDSEVCGVSEAALLAGLYTDHTIKDELVLGPEVLQRPNIARPGELSRREESGVVGWGRACSVRLERLPPAAPERPDHRRPRTSPHYSLYQCQHCGKRFRTNTALRTHATLVHKLYAYTHECHCGKRFRNEFVFKQHVHTLPELSDPSLKNVLDGRETSHDAKKRFKCRYGYCKFNSDNKLEFEQHQKLHGGFRCKLCDFMCSRKSQLQTHNCKKKLRSKKNVVRSAN